MILSDQNLIYNLQSALCKVFHSQKIENWLKLRQKDNDFSVE